MPRKSFRGFEASVRICNHLQPDEMIVEFDTLETRRRVLVMILFVDYLLSSLIDPALCVFEAF
jgi:hypothetical protein